MQCISPILVRSSGRRDFVPCGKCNFCLATRRFDWSFRLQQELKQAKTANFLTFTYNDQYIPINNESGKPELCKRDVQLFTKQLRKRISSLQDETNLRYYTCGEYGTRTARPHYHSIMFNLPEKVKNDLPNIWTKGHIHVGDVNIATINYVTKYVINRVGDYTGREPPFSLMSKRPGLGSNYLDSHTKWHRADMRNYTNVNGIKARLPRYYKDKMFTDLERKIMAQETIYENDIVYLEELERLQQFHDDPYIYHEERVRFAHETIQSKENQNAKF